ncbi:DNA replication factor Dna2-domain-containing protein [Globomyces pollinis-pini]|nr:DNA replication factor Dna2-domain-containing protein [Globomyces pollinis-pini]
MNNQISWKETPPTLHCNSSPIHSSPVLFSKRIINPIHYNTIKSSNVINPSHTSGRDTIDSISTSFINTANTSGRDKDQANPLVCRFLVLEVSLSNHSYSLLALNSTTNAPTTISISGQAALSTIHQGHYIHIIYNDFNDDLGLLIVLPDILVSCTTASDTTCVRRSILKDKIKYYSPTTKAMIHGNIIHSLFQKAISASNLSKLDLEIMLKQLITDSISDLYSIGGDEQSTFIELVPHLPKILDWLRLNLVHSPLQ